MCIFTYFILLRHVSCTDTDYGCECRDPCEVCVGGESCSGCSLPVCNNSLVDVDQCITSTTAEQTTVQYTKSSTTTLSDNVTVSNTSTLYPNSGYRQCGNLSLCDFCNLCSPCASGSCSDCDVVDTCPDCDIMDICGSCDVINLCADVEVSCTCKASVCGSDQCSVCTQQRCISFATNGSSQGSCIWDWRVRDFGYKYDVAYHLVVLDLNLQVSRCWLSSFMTQKL